MHIYNLVCLVSFPVVAERSLFLIFEIFFLLFRAACAAYRSSQARGRIQAAAAGLHHSHSNARSKLCLWPTPQLTARVAP